jgi:hypothetical protein
VYGAVLMREVEKRWMCIQKRIGEMGEMRERGRKEVIKEELIVVL